MTAVLRMCEPVTTPWPPTPAMRMLKRFAIAIPPSPPNRRCAAYAIGRAAAVAGFVADVFGERVPVVLYVLRVFHHLISWDGVLDVAGSVSLDVGRADLARDQDGLFDHALDPPRVVGDYRRYIGTPGELGHADHVHLFKLLAQRGHLQNLPLVGHAALLAAGIAVHFIVQHDRREPLLPEPGMKGHAEADIGHAAVAGHDHHILGLITEPQSQSPTEPACNGTLVPIVPIHEGDGRLGDGQTPAAGRAHRDGVLWVGEGDHGQPDEQGHRAPRTHRMLFQT